MFALLFFSPRSALELKEILNLDSSCAERGHCHLVIVPQSPRAVFAIMV